jgi:hypothetical protein
MKSGDYIKAKELIQLQGFGFSNRDFIAKDEIVQIMWEIKKDEFLIRLTMSHDNKNPISIDRNILENKFEIYDKPIK